MKKLNTIILLLFCAFLVKAQTPRSMRVDSVFNTRSYQSSSMASMVQDIVYPVNYSTGLLTINIPLYEVVSGELHLPITLSYHGDGIKANTPCCWVGQNWSLMCEPLLAKVVKGRDDQSMNYRCDITRDVSYWDKFRSAENMIDEQPDEYYFRLANNQGMFMYSMEPKDSSRKFLPIPYQNIRIERTSNAFVLTDDKGVSYCFDDKNRESSSTAVTGWKPSLMLSAERQDSIVFSYRTNYENHKDYPDNISVIDDFSELFDLKTDREFYQGAFTGDRYIETRSMMVPLKDYWMQDPVVYNTVYNNASTTYTNHTYQSTEDGELYSDNYLQLNDHGTAESGNIMIEELKTLKYKYGTIDFVHVSSTRLLDRIVVRDLQGKVVRKIAFHYNKKFGENRSFLTRLEITGGEGKHCYRYSFNYEDMGNAPEFGTKSIDYWGYYNGVRRNDTTTLVPYQTIMTTRCRFGRDPVTGGTVIYTGGTIPVHIGSKLSREVDETFMKKGILKSITYPTGRTDQFDYEVNQSRDLSGNPRKVGGLRIKKIATRDGEKEVMVRTFKYGADEDGTGYSPLSSGKNALMLERKRYYMGAVAVISDGLCDIINFDTQKIITARQRFYYGSPIYSNTYYGLSPVMYDWVTEYQGTPEYNTGKTVYKYCVNKDTLTIDPQRYVPNGKLDSWKYGLLTGKQVYKNQSGTYILSEKEEYSYGDKEGFGRVISVDIDNPVIADDKDEAWRRGFYSIYREWNEIPVGTRVLLESTHTKYDGQGRHLATHTDYEYDQSDHALVLSRMSRTVNGSDAQSVAYTYPKDYAESVYKRMDSANLYPTVSTVYRKGGKYLSVTTPYEETSPKVFRPVSQAFKYSEGDSDVVRVSYAYDNSGNKRQVIKDGKERLVLLYGYKHHYVVARIENATYAEVSSVFPGKESGIESMSESMDMEAWQSALSSLREALPKARVTTYTVNPQSGSLLSETSPDGTKICYEYDELDRLTKKYRRLKGKIEMLNQYEYRYKTENAQ